MQPGGKSLLIGMELRTHTCAMRKRDLSNRLGRSGRASNEQCIAPKSPIARILMVALLRRLGECQRSPTETLHAPLHDNHDLHCLAARCAIGERINGTASIRDSGNRLKASFSIDSCAARAGFHRSVPRLQASLTRWSDDGTYAACAGLPG